MKKHFGNSDVPGLRMGLSQKAQPLSTATDLVGKTFSGRQYNDGDHMDKVGEDSAVKMNLVILGAQLFAIPTCGGPTPSAWVRATSR